MNFVNVTKIKRQLYYIKYKNTENKENETSGISPKRLCLAKKSTQW